MLTVHKFPLSYNDSGFSGPVARIIQPLHVDLQNGIPCLWAMVDTDAINQVDIIITGTGHQVQRDWVHCGSYQDGRFVWHVWIPSWQIGTPV